MSSMSTSSAGRSRSFIFSASSTFEFQQKSGRLSISVVCTLILVPWWLISLSSTCRLSYVLLCGYCSLILFWFEHEMSISYVYCAHFELKWNGVGIGPRHLWVLNWPYKYEGELLQKVWRDWRWAICPPSSGSLSLVGHCWCWNRCKSWNT